MTPDLYRIGAAWASAITLILLKNNYLHCSWLGILPYIFTLGFAEFKHYHYISNIGVVRAT